MALVPCRECSVNISTNAVLCPHCGIARPGTTILANAVNVFKKMLLALVVLAIVAALFLKASEYLIKSAKEALGIEVQKRVDGAVDKIKHPFKK